MRFLMFLKSCIAAYRIAYSRGNGVGYVAVLDHGVPEIIVLVGTGREAWRVSTVATEAYALKPLASVERPNG